MKLVRCQKCKQMYELVSIHNKYCPSCTQREHEKYINVRTYVKDNPGISVRQVADDLGVNASLVLRYLKEEKLEIAGGTNVYLKCELCGAEITTGRYCQSCKRNIAVEETQHFTSSTQSTDNVGMMFTAKHKK